MHRARILNKVLSGPRMSHKELLRQQLALESVARTAGGDHVGRIVRATTRKRMHVIERGVEHIERRRAVHAALAAVTQATRRMARFMAMRTGRAGAVA